MTGKVLITGINGFAASYLARNLIASNYAVHGIARRNSDDSRLKYLKIDKREQLTVHVGDVTDKSSMRSIINEVRPDFIFNLAAIMYVQDSWDIPEVTFNTNTLGLLNILEIVKDLNYKFYEYPVRIIQAGTSEEYGFVLPSECPVSEQNHLRPMSPYGISKVAADHLCQIYRDAYDLDIIVTRAFNHAGPLQVRDMVIPSFIRGVMSYAFYGDTIKHGDFTTVRDFIHVEDVARAYARIVDLKTDIRDDRTRQINICSGKGVSMGDIMDMAIRIVEEYYGEYIKFGEFSKNMKQTYFRPNDVPFLEGDNSKMKDLTGWEPQKDLYNIVSDIAVWLFNTEFVEKL